MDHVDFISAAHSGCLVHSHSSDSLAMERQSRKLWTQAMIVGLYCGCEKVTCILQASGFCLLVCLFLVCKVRPVLTGLIHEFSFFVCNILCNISEPSAVLSHIIVILSLDLLLFDRTLICSLELAQGHLPTVREDLPLFP